MTDQELVFAGRWEYCPLCECAIISCKECMGSTCNGHSCEVCKKDFEEAIKLDGPSKRELMGDQQELFKRYFLRKWYYHLNSSGMDLFEGMPSVEELEKRILESINKTGNLGIKYLFNTWLDSKGG